MSIEIVPTGAALGAEICGVNLARPIDDETFAAVVFSPCSSPWACSWQPGGALLRKARNRIRPR